MSGFFCLQILKSFTPLLYVGIASKQSKSYDKNHNRIMIIIIQTLFLYSQLCV